MTTNPKVPAVLQSGARGLGRKIRRSMKGRGLIGTIKYCAAYLVRPSLRRHEASPSTFDLRFGVNTSGLIHINDLDVADGRRINAVGYQATAPEMFREAVSNLEIRHPEFTFIDVGCGKGLILLLA